LQLVLDEGVWEEVLTITADDADNLQDVLKNTKNEFYDIGRRGADVRGHQNRRLNACGAIRRGGAVDCAALFAPVRPI
jgi:hypothetical protein